MLRSVAWIQVLLYVADAAVSDDEHQNNAGGAFTI
jgi:hypothetical protein